MSDKKRPNLDALLTAMQKEEKRLMVAVSSSPSSEDLIRWTQRIAYNLKVPWIVAYVKTSSFLSQDDEVRLSKYLTLAQELGGEVVTTTDEDVSRGLLRLVRQHNVTQIVVGQSPRSWWTTVFKGSSIVDKLVREGKGIDLSIVSAKNQQQPPQSSLWLWRQYFTSGLKQYSICIGVISVVIGLSFFLSPAIGNRSVALLLLFTVSLLALFFGRGPVLASATFSALLWNFLFLHPRFTFYIHSVEDGLMFVMYFVIALVAGHLTTRLRSREQVVRRNEERTTVLYQLAKESSRAVTLDEVLHSAIHQIGQVFGAQIAVLLPNASGQLSNLSNQPHPASTRGSKALSWEEPLQKSSSGSSGSSETLVLNEKEFDVATWVFKNAKPAGQFTDTLPMAEGYYLPLVTATEVVGVLGLRGLTSFSIEQQALLEALAGQLALVIERTRLTEIAAHSKMLVESDRLYKTLLNSVSHELRTPIVTIAGAAASLLDPSVNRHQETRASLVQEIQEATERLKRVVENLLDMTRLESGYMQLHLDWCDVTDLISMALKRTASRLKRHRVTTTLPQDLPLVRLDFVLMEQVLTQLLDNAALYTPPGTQIEVSARLEEATLLLSVADNGPGLKPEEIERVFEKFYRGARVPTGGTGLGLSICRGLVEAHGGQIIAENQEPGGARFTIRLPLGSPPPPVEETTL